MADLTLEQRTAFLSSVHFDFEQRQEIERVLEWLTDFPDEAAAYIVWLQGTVSAYDGGPEYEDGPEFKGWEDRLLRTENFQRTCEAVNRLC